MRRVFVVIALLCLLAPAGAHASKRGGEALIRDCAEDGFVNDPKKYSDSDYQYAVRHIPTDLDEYTNCRDTINSAHLALFGGSRHGGATGPLNPFSNLGDLSHPTQGEKAAVGEARKNGGAPVRIGPGPPALSVITPGGKGLRASSRAHSLPTSLLVVLALIALALLARAVITVRSSVLARRKT